MTIQKDRKVVSRKPMTAMIIRPHNMFIEQQPYLGSSNGVMFNTLIPILSQRGIAIIPYCINCKAILEVYDKNKDEEGNSLIFHCNQCSRDWTQEPWKEPKEIKG